MPTDSSSTAVADAPSPAPRTDRPLPDTAPAPVTPPPPALPASLQPPAKKRRGPVFWLVVLVLGTGALLWTARFVWHAFNYEETDDAYVNGHVHQVSFRVSGAVTDVRVDDNQTVKVGQTLARVDPLEYEIALHRAQAMFAQAQAEEAKARATVAQSQAQVTQMGAQVQQAQAQVERAQAQSETAGVDFNRSSRLYNNDKQAIAKSQVDTDKGALDAAQAALSAAKANLAGVQSNVVANQAQVESAQAALAAAQANVGASEAAVKDAERELSYTTLAAPSDGRIGNKNVETGNRVQAGQALFALVEPDLWVIANFKETQLAKMHDGQPVEITVDAIPAHTFPGRIDSISPATGAQFALLPPDNATGNFTKVVQRVPVKVVFDRDGVRGYENRIRPGLSSVVNVRVR